MKAWIRAALLWAAATLSYGHVVSLSNGELVVQGRTAEYVLRMPAYEVEHVSDPETALLQELRFGTGKRVASNCSREGEEFVCRANYEFDQELPDQLEVECTLYRATVPNHIHMLYARQGENADQRVFDQNQSVIEMRFRPPSFWESVRRDGGDGARRFLTSFSGVLFVLVIALSARAAREAFLLGALFLAAEWMVRPIAPFLPIGLSAEFLEAVMALTAAYLSAELLFVPEGRARWVIIPLLGLIHGLPYVAFPGLHLAGAEVLQVGLLALLSIGLTRLPKHGKKAAAGLCLGLALLWFASLVIG